MVAVILQGVGINEISHVKLVTILCNMLTDDDVTECEQTHDLWIVPYARKILVKASNLRIVQLNVCYGDCANKHPVYSVNCHKFCRQ